AVLTRTVTSAELSHAMFGTDFSSAARIAFIVSAAGEAYRDIVGRASDARPGIKNPDGRTTYDRLTYDHNRAPRVQDPQTGEWRETRNFGLNRTDPETGLPCYMCQGSGFSNFVNPFPGMNAIATLHDDFMNNLPWSNSLSIVMMPPAAIISEVSILEQYDLYDVLEQVKRR
ncbi:MAG: hypothetical protein ACREHG_11400, partial [Candidatus Saccharimonadales bacterium]